MLAIQVSRTGGPEVLEAVEVPTPTAGPGQILVRHEAVGVNFIDTYLRSGLYPMKLPSILGQEAAGVVAALGEGVDRFRIGDRVAYFAGGGGYAGFGVVPADRAVPLPEAIAFEIAAAALLKGMTAEFLLRRCHPVQAGEAILVQAAAGGVGTLVTQWAKRLGAVVIGTVGSEDKAVLARAHGCDHVILYRHEDVAARVRDITGGEGVTVAYDSVGKDTLEGSLSSLARRGILVSYGNASGPAPAIPPLRLMQGGSLFLTRPTLGDYVRKPEELADSAAQVFALITSGAVRVEIGQRFPLTEAEAAHRALEARQTVGATVLTP